MFRSQRIPMFDELGKLVPACWKSDGIRLSLKAILAQYLEDPGLPLLVDLHSTETYLPISSFVVSGSNGGGSRY